jgi:hypothetical protein
VENLRNRLPVVLVCSSGHRVFAYYVGGPGFNPQYYIGKTEKRKKGRKGR